MATCPKCKNFYMGSECPFCRIECMQPQYQQEAKEREERTNRISAFRAEWEDKFFCVTTPLLDGYKVERYCGTVSGSAALGTGWLSEFRTGFSDLFGSESNAFSEKLEEVKNAAMKKAISSALDYEANALIGLDVDYQMFSGNVIAAIVSGTAVFVKKID